MSDVRVEVWAVKAARRKATAAPELKMLPPTTAAFKLNVWRAHIQTDIWMSCMEADPAPLDPILHGWCADNLAKSLVLLILPPTTPLAPMELLEMIHCCCASHLASQHNVIVMLPNFHAQFSVRAMKNQTVGMKKQLRLQRLMLKSSICDDMHVQCPGIH